MLVSLQLRCLNCQKRWIQRCMASCSRGSSWLSTYTLWMFSKAPESVFTESVFYQLGFGQCSKQPRISEDAADLAMRCEAAMVSPGQDHCAVPERRR